MLKDISVYWYYGNYNNSYIIRLVNIFTEYPDVIKELQTYDIVFKYSGTSFLFCIDEIDLK